ncbi:response regulator [Limnobacter sp.]|uniref:response regulator n=1 Tax=Limnobacter sp. TaxID=2003368 RepID=UPI003516FB42
MNAISEGQLTRNLLIVDDEDNVLRALVRLMRRDGYTLHIARSVREAFEILATRPVEVVLSDQRMPEKNGTVFLSEVKEKYPHTVRLMLSGYTEVGAVTSAINEGAIYKFLTKPWDDEQLRANVREAFQRHDMESQNHRLHREIEEVNAELLLLNHRLEQELQAKNERIRRDYSVVGVLQEMIDLLPLGVLGLDHTGELVWINGSACALLKEEGQSQEGTYLERLPQNLQDLLSDYLMADDGEPQTHCLQVSQRTLQVDIKPLGVSSESLGCMVVLQVCAKGGQR